MPHLLKLFGWTCWVGTPSSPSGLRVTLCQHSDPCGGHCCPQTQWSKCDGAGIQQRHWPPGLVLRVINEHAWKFPPAVTSACTWTTVDVAVQHFCIISLDSWEEGKPARLTQLLGKSPNCWQGERKGSLVGVSAQDQKLLDRELLQLCGETVIF